MTGADKRSCGRKGNLKQIFKELYNNQRNAQVFNLSI
jgi:hypothetical protein